MREPTFPPELEREIFQEAALADSGTITQLLLVCHRVYIWIEPFLYRVLLMNSEDTLYGISAALESKPASFFKKAVRHLWLVNFSPEARDTSVELLRILPRIENLFIMESLHPISDPDVLHSIGEKCTRLGLMLLGSGYWPEKRLESSICAFITHLILQNMRNEMWNKWARLADLPALTHLCLAQEQSNGLLGDVLSKCPRLDVIVYMCIQRKAAEDAFYPRTDSRLVVMWLADNYRADWERGARGGDDFWARAEKFLERKMRGEIEKSRFLLTHD